MAKIIKITESQYEMLEATYPDSFNIKEFASLTSFAARKRYADQRLTYLAGGTGRLVYHIDDVTVLKLAKNQKGVAQNWTEIRQWNQNDHIMATVHEYSEDGLWLEMEKARKAKAADFKKIVGFNFKDIAQLLQYREEEIKGRGKNIFTPPDNAEDLYEEEFYSQLENVVFDWGLKSGDLARINSYGVVKRSGEEEIVLTDYGLDEHVWKTHYAPKKQAWQKHFY